MLYLSDGFSEAVRRHTPMTARVAAYDSTGKYIADTFYDPRWIRLLGQGSTVSYDQDNNERSQASLNFLVDSVDGLAMLDSAAYTELRPYLGVEVDGDMEWAPMGVFTATETKVNPLNDTVSMVNVQCSDRTERISNNPWYKPFAVASGLTYYQAMALVLADRARGFTPVLITDDATSGLLTPAMKFNENEDPWAGAIVRMAEAQGSDVYFDREGSIVARKLLDPGKVTPAVTLNTPNGDHSQLGTPTLTSNRRQTFSGVICKAEAPWLLFPVSATVWDDDPGSPTWRNGPMGERPLTITDSLATTQAQCALIAQARLEKIKGQAEDLELGMLRDPRLEVGDTIERYSAATDTLNMYRLVRLSFDLGSGTMQATGRRRR